MSSITIDGEVFQSIVTPSSYALTRLGPDGHNRNDIIRNGNNVANSSSNANWNTRALASFQDKNLNHYFFLITMEIIFVEIFPMQRQQMHKYDHFFITRVFPPMREVLIEAAAFRAIFGNGNRLDVQAIYL